MHSVPPIDPKLLADTIPWFGQLPEPVREWLVGELEALTLPGGATLFTAGSASDCVYLLLSGSLGAFAPDDPTRVIGQVVAGETVGETGLITGRPRSATVRALRDSELLRLGRPKFEELAHRAPQAAMAMARQALDRATVPQGQRQSLGPRTLALLPQTDGVDTSGFARSLAQALTRFGSVTTVGAGDGQGHDPGWFAALEAQHRYVIYVANAADDAWRQLALRQADALVFLAEPGAQPAPWAECARGVVAPLPRPEHLALVHMGKPRLGAGRRWSRLRPRAQLHHVRNAEDVGRVARLAVGRSLSLVLSGGGARGFAHIGVIKALREAGMKVDAVGGTSIGAIIGAGLACDWSTEEMIVNFRRCFVETNPLSQWTLPVVSIKSGAKVSRLLRETFGEREIEDLVLPYFCVSADLTEGRAAVHRSGPVWQWLRASVAIPGVLPPVFLGGQVHVDGGVINNLPVDVMRETHHGEVIAVDIGGDHAVRAHADEIDLPPWWKLIPDLFGRGKRPGILQLLLRAGMVNSGAATVAARQSSSLLLAPALGNIDLLDWQAFDRAVDIGYQCAVRTLGGDFDSFSAQAPLVG